MTPLGWRRYGWRAPLELLARTITQVDHAARRLALVAFHDIQLGEGSLVERDVQLSRGCRVRVGARSFVGRRSTIELAPTSGWALDIGDDSWISHDCHLSAMSPLSIGRKVLVGEMVSIRDSQHRYHDRAVPIKDQGDEQGSITIEDDVWIGRGACILGRPEGVVVGRGAVIAAHSVVHASVPPYTIWAGAPARQIGVR